MGEITGKWVHAHEEDTDGAMVFRPASHPLPPSRGRLRLELRPDGTYVEHAPGPTDAPIASEGDWSRDGRRLTLGGAGDRGGHDWEVVSAAPDRLVLRR